MKVKKNSLFYCFFIGFSGGKLFSFCILHDVLCAILACFSFTRQEVSYYLLHHFQEFFCRQHLHHVQLPEQKYAYTIVFLLLSEPIFTQLLGKYPPEES